MITRQVGSGGLQTGDSPGQPGPAWTAVLAAYTTVFIPLSSSLYSRKALDFFLWLKQMKQLEQEKDVLLAGLDILERARDWYQKQISSVVERQKHVGQSAHCVEKFLASTQSHLNVLLPKLQEVNCCLSDLISCYGMEFTNERTSNRRLEQKCGLTNQLFEEHAENIQGRNTMGSTVI